MITATARDDGVSSMSRHRILGEFREMPCLSLTLAQASRLFSLPEAACGGALRTLVDERLLRLGEDGRYRLASR